MKYIDFASKISFYEFLQSEFKPPHFIASDYEKEIKAIPSSMTVERLAKTLEESPRLFDVLEELFQLDHFTDAQYIHFCFDVNKLNTADDSLVLRYFENRVFKFENGKENYQFKRIYEGVTSKHTSNKKEVIFYTKRAIVSYVARLLNRSNPNKRKILYEHIANSIETRLRISTYLIENLNAPDLLHAVDVDAFLAQKRHPIDTRGLHGRFGITKISQILQDAGYSDVTEEIEDKDLSPKSLVPIRQEFAFVREKSVIGIVKRSNKKPKKFDFVLLRDGIPKILIETNFYSTSGGGTKIGINENEYTALHSDIEQFNRVQGTKLLFMWITDGNYWLSSDGENRFTNLKDNYFKRPFELLNYNLLREMLPSIKKNLI